MLTLSSTPQVALEELQDLKGVWSELSKVWEQIDQMKEQPWVSVQPRKVQLVGNVCTYFPGGVRPGAVLGAPHAHTILLMSALPLRVDSFGRTWTGF